MSVIFAIDNSLQRAHVSIIPTIGIVDLISWLSYATQALNWPNFILYRKGGRPPAIKKVIVVTDGQIMVKRS